MTIRAAVAACALAALLASPTVRAQGATASPDLSTAFASRFDVGGRSMFLECEGRSDPSRPTIIAEAGMGADSSTLTDLIGRLGAAGLRACAYDRIGLGRSDRPSGPVTTADAAVDLRSLLAVAGVMPPYVLVGHSLGGWYVRTYTAAYPDDVVGLVFIDASHPDQEKRFLAMIPPKRPGEYWEFADYREGFAFSEYPWDNPDIGFVDLATSEQQVRESGDLGDRPVVVLTSAFEMSPWFELPEPYGDRLYLAWRTMHAELASLSTRGDQRTVEGAGHFIQDDRPDAVVQAVEDVVAAVTAGPDAADRSNVSRRTRRPSMPAATRCSTRFAAFAEARNARRREIRRARQRDSPGGGAPPAQDYWRSVPPPGAALGSGHDRTPRPGRRAAARRTPGGGAGPRLPPSGRRRLSEHHLARRDA